MNRENKVSCRMKPQFENGQWKLPMDIRIYRRRGFISAWIRTSVQLQHCDNITTMQKFAQERNQILLLGNGRN